MSGEESVPCRLSVRQFSAQLSDSVVHYCVLKMENSFFLWIGAVANPALRNLALALPTKSPAGGQVTATRLMGDMMDSSSSAIAARLSKRTGCQVFVSCNLPQTDPMLLSLVEERLAEELRVNPGYFIDAAK